jgi:hypothetical protein
MKPDAYTHNNTLSKGFFIYDNLLHRGELAGHSGILAGHRGGDVTHPDEAQSCTLCHGLALIIYILPLVGIIAYLSFGELHLGASVGRNAHASGAPTAKWLNDLGSLQTHLC